MSSAGAAAAALLTELVRRGIELQPYGDRLRYRPRSALTPELAERVRRHKPVLLALLRQDRPSEAPLSGQNRPVSGAAPEVGRDRSAGSVRAPGSVRYAPRAFACRANRKRLRQSGLDSAGVGRSAVPARRPMRSAPPRAGSAVPNVGGERAKNEK